MKEIMDEIREIAEAEEDNEWIFCGKDKFGHRVFVERERW